MADRLPRYAEGPAEFFLTNALSRGKRAVGDCLDQPLVGPIDQGRLRIKRLHPLAFLNSEFDITRLTETSKGYLAVRV